VRMPLLSDTMTEGKIVAWSKQVGDTVKSDDVMAEVETDKATMEVMPYADGTLLHIGVEAGSAAKVNDIIAIIGPAGTDISGILAAEKASTTNTPKATSQASASTTTTNQTITPASPTTPNQTDGGDARSKISPLAKRLAQEKGIDINQVVGSGDNGRIVKRDIENYQPTAQTASPTVNVGNSASAQTAIGQESYTDTPVSQMRKVIAI
jgi:pyruvate dehydrogenase E2 component (dihydrolipoamide acetyltransferase)